MTPIAVGYALAIVAVICYSSLGIVSKKAMLNGMPPFAFISLSMFLLCAFSGLVSLCFEKGFRLTALQSGQWMNIALLSVINLGAFGLYLFALQRIPVAHYQILEVVGAVVGIVLAFFILGEPIKPNYFYGLALIAAGLYVALGVNRA